MDILRSISDFGDRKSRAYIMIKIWKFLIYILERFFDKRIILQITNYLAPKKEKKGDK